MVPSTIWALCTLNVFCTDGIPDPIQYIVDVLYAFLWACFVGFRVVGLFFSAESLVFEGSGFGFGNSRLA